MPQPLQTASGAPIILLSNCQRDAREWPRAPTCTLQAHQTAWPRGPGERQPPEPRGAEAQRQGPARAGAAGAPPPPPPRATRSENCGARWGGLEEMPIGHALVALSFRRYSSTHEVPLQFAHPTERHVLTTSILTLQRAQLLRTLAPHRSHLVAKYLQENFVGGPPYGGFLPPRLLRGY